MEACEALGKAAICAEAKNLVSFHTMEPVECWILGLCAAHFHVLSLSTIDSGSCPPTLTLLLLLPQSERTPIDLAK